MRKIALPGTIVGAMLVTFLQAAPAQAQADRTWVSASGNDANPCSLTAPCKTFGGAISSTNVNGEINCVDAGGFGPINITKSITVDCHDVFASILASGAGATTGIFVNFDSFAEGDTRRTVRLRNININGASTATRGIRIIGAASGSEVFIEDCLIDGFLGAGARGISDERAGGGYLFISNTTVRNVTTAGILVQPATGSQRIEVVADKVRVQRAGSGVSIVNGARAMINRSVFSGNGGGIVAEAAIGTTEVNVDSSAVSNNFVGVLTSGSTTVRLSNTDIAFNGTGISGTTFSFSNNRISGNNSAGAAPTPIGAATNPTGQQ